MVFRLAHDLEMRMVCVALWFWNLEMHIMCDTLWFGVRGMHVMCDMSWRRFGFSFCFSRAARTVILIK
jgi:hypothetical protein